ncbi:hypothetical protein [Mesoplasma lactucae]|uniref:Uncharacterized protein n=1 Tax=Mesoplasma lactucae ATCC 49193 TaxID=81460 RepID=A0A291IRU4_9MOLU|nr:hypothetical protein [Mesoplasma lactucae]ATG97503.1 hypothetical protein CP520_01915 [Mesoplasma lactucae ATCC 49193]ATZ20041.1 hypothetical protein MLACT_v1c02190 [Mesoplasma lactucae ATCC 49193]MCL8217008.1 hypothetical protein [Mesoplasma lactucae ATCC 49193]
MDLEKEKIPKPKPTWHCFIPFSKTRQVYKNDLERYEQQFLDPIGKIRLKENKAINELSGLIITVLTMTLGFVPWFSESLPSFLEWMKLGLAPSNQYSWADHLMAFIVPAAGGSVAHFVPKKLPGKVGKIVNLIIKILPVVILIIWLINREIDIHKIKKQNKKAFKTSYMDCDINPESKE